MKKKHGLKIKKNQSFLTELKKSLPHWEHDKVEDETYMGGYKYLPSCTCSECGYHSNQEKDVCPNCGANMHTLEL